MKTTNLLAELFVIGVWGLIWCIPIFKEILNPKYFNYLFSPNFNSAIIILAIIYFLGMCVNFLSDLIFSYFDKKIAEKHGGKNMLHGLRSRILLSTSDASNYMFQRRSFIRIFRANTFNFILILISFIIDL